MKQVTDEVEYYKIEALVAVLQSTESVTCLSVK